MNFPFGAGFFQDANHIEAGLWIGIGLGFLVRAALKAAFRKECLIAAITFIAFGFSDIVEARTGAWWRPWWLLVWKGVCVLVFLILLVKYVKQSRAIAFNPPSHSIPSGQCSPDQNDCHSTPD